MLEEQEVHFSMSADKPDTWVVYADYPKWQRKLERIGATLVKVEKSGGKHYELPAKQLSLRNPAKPRKPMTSDEKAQLRTQLSAHRTNT